MCQGDSPSPPPTDPRALDGKLFTGPPRPLAPEGSFCIVGFDSRLVSGLMVSAIEAGTPLPGRENPARRMVRPTCRRAGNESCRRKGAPSQSTYDMDSEGRARSKVKGGVRHASGLLKSSHAIAGPR